MLIMKIFFILNFLCLLVDVYTYTGTTMDIVAIIANAVAMVVCGLVVLNED